MPPPTPTGGPVAQDRFTACGLINAEILTKYDQKSALIKAAGGK
jgi:hypothetical protein